MPSVRFLQRSFGAGEMSPEMYGRVDDARFQSGLATCRNFEVLPQGPARNRAGFQYVLEVKDSAKQARLIPFTFSQTDTMIVEVGEGYFRFHSQGRTLGTDGLLHEYRDDFTPYEIENDYLEADLFSLHYVQSSDVLTLVHPNYSPKELRRLGAASWAFVVLDMTPVIAPPPTVTAVATGFTAEKYVYGYVVTAIATDGVSESVASTPATCRGNLFESGCTVNVSWVIVPGALRYYVYKAQGGLYGYIGSTETASLVDDNIAPDLSRTPPIYDDIFAPNGILSVPVTATGSGYGTVAAGGAITAVNVVAGGNSYTTPVIDITDPTGSGAVFSCNVIGGALDSVTVVDGGAGYTAPILTVREGAALGAGVGAAVSVEFTPRTSFVTLSISDPTGTGARLSPVLSGGEITAVVVVSAGKNYTAPVVTVGSASGGIGATFGAPTLTGLDYPGAVSYFEQRRCFAGTKLYPQNIWMTRSGTESNMSYSLPVRDDDRIAVRVAARESNTIQHIVPLSQLILLTSAAEWRVTSINSDAITPTSISVKPQSYVGSSAVQPCIINNSLVYCAARGGHVRELGYSWQSNGFVTNDLALRAAHLFDTFSLSDMAFSKAPIPILWFVSSTGKLLGFTYVPEQQVGAWHQHDTVNGAFESCACVAEGAEDVLYVVVRRTINGETKRYVERLATRLFSSLEEACFVDASVTVTGDALTTISGLDHLEGQIVSVLADGKIQTQKTVSSGSISLDAAADTVQVGLPITADLVTLPAALGIDSAAGQGRRKNVNRAWVRVFNSAGFWVGPDTSHLSWCGPAPRTPGVDVPLVTDEVQLVLTPEWGQGGQVAIRQTDPVPLDVVAMTLEIAVGG